MDVTGNKFQHQSSTPKTVELQYLRAITKQFSEDQILGKGGFGTVYKGEKEDGEVVAVKKLINMVGMDDKQFLSEVKHLVGACHPNIVRLEGYCYHIERVLTPYNGSLIWVDEVYRLLCFEYLPNGSLDKHITDESSGLDWHKRYNIIEGICKGLHYLHEGRRGEPILHLDLKPSNILLDKNMVPKIADFGLSRLFGEEKTHTCTMNLRGSFGYMPPECIEKRMISKESDIFSLGVIIIEIVTGHRKYPDDTTTQEFIEVPEKWRRRLQTTSNYTSLEEDCRQVNQCIEVGLKCMERERKKRPNMREIIELLNGSENMNSGLVREDGFVLCSRNYMNPVVVQDRRNKSNEKSYPPKLDDRVHRLEEITNDGTYCKRLEEKHIFTVQDFLRALNKDPDNLAKVLHIKKEHKPWEKMVRHARECCLEGKHELTLYRNAYGNVEVELFFNWVHYLVGAAFDGGYIASDKFNPAQRAIADKLKERAYDELEVLPFNYIMEGGFPVPTFMNANPFESSCANANNDPCSSTPDHRNIHNYQDQGTRPSSQEQFSWDYLIDWDWGQAPLDRGQTPLGRLNSSHGTTEGFYSGAGAEDDELALLNQPFAVNQPCCVAPGFDQAEIQRQLFLHSDDVLSTSTHSNLHSTVLLDLFK